MTTAVETLTKLSRRMTISVPMDSIEKEVEARLKKLSRTVKMAGFRPGKVPLKMVAQQYGYQVQNEVLNDKVGQAFNQAASENQLRIAGMPKMEPKAGESQPEGAVEFDAVFEVYPDVVIGDFTVVDVEKVGASVTDTEVDKTIDILRKQRVQYTDSAEGDAAQSEDKVTVDFVGKLDDVAFPGGTASDYDFVLGQGRMLPEFEAAATGLKVGESKSFPLSFPEDYHGKDVAGKTATFTITMKKIAKPQLPELNDEFAKTLGIEDGDLAKMREDIKTNLEREVKKRTQLRTKESVMEGLIKVAEFDVPAALIEADVERLRAQAHTDMQSRGMDPKNINLPAELFSTQAERRVRLGLILAELVKQHNLAAKPEQLKAAVEEFAQSYENPMEVIRWYYSDPKRLGEVEALVLEDNVVEFVLSKAKVTEKALGFEELMGAQGQQ